MQRSGLSGSYGRRGFTMVELLTVIAIIAILAGILFPVFATVRKNVHKATCATNLHSIAQGLKLYKDDHGAYPEALYSVFSAPPGGGTATEISFLYPNYVKEPQIFHCPLAPFKTDNTNTVQAQHPLRGETKDFFRQYANRAYHVWDSYDGQFDPPGSNNYVVKYLRHWSGPQAGFGDNPHQLLYKNPPEDTVVTWCTYHRDWTNRTSANAEPQTGSIDQVLFLDGHVKSVPSNLMYPLTPAPNHSFLVGRGD